MSDGIKWPWTPHVLAYEANAAEQKRRADCYDDLLKALEWALSKLNCEPYEWTDEDDANAHEGARAAIAKARGETQ